MGLPHSLRRGLLAVAATAAFAAPAVGQDKEPIKIGVIYDYTGPFAGGGSAPAGVL